jgi:Surface glycan-binding protein B xyloglucan binding domain
MKRVLLFIIVLAGLVQFACKKNSSGGQPVVKDVRSVTPAEADSFFTSALPGTLIVIQGSGFNGLQAVYFNDTAVAFNPVYATNTNIIVTIPATAQTAATDPSVPSVIKIVTSHGTVSYPFTLYLPKPVINSISVDNTGTVLYISGTNLTGIQKITFPIGNSDTATSYTVNTTYTQIVAGIPTGTVAVDSIRVYCTFGVASFGYPPPMIIGSISDENATAGTSITITGRNFIGVAQVLFPGGIPGTNLVVQNVNQMTVSVPPGITTTDSLRLQGALGISASPQLFDSYITFTSPGYLCTFENQNATDNTGFVGWTGGYANATQSATAYPDGTGAVGVLLQGGPMSPNIGPTSLANPGDLNLNDEPWVSNTADSIAGYSLKFEIYVASPWKAGEIWIAVGDWYDWTSYTARYAPWDTAAGGTYQPTGWTTVTIPLTQFITGNQFYQTTWSTSGSPAVHFSDYPYTSLCFMITNDQAATVPVNSINVAIDNVRIVKGQ